MKILEKLLPVKVTWPIIGVMYGYIAGFFMSLFFFYLGAYIISFFVNTEMATPLWVGITVKFLYFFGFVLCMGYGLRWGLIRAHLLLKKADQKLIQRRTTLHFFIAFNILIVFGAVLNLLART